MGGKAMKLFKKDFEITLKRVHDTLIVRECEEKLRLVVNGDALRMVSGINKAVEKLNALTDESGEEAMREAAEYYAVVLFGKDQARKLMEFYAEDAGCVLTVCTKYVTQRLGQKIAEAQKKMSVNEAV
jgi:hypothetical protein